MRYDRKSELFVMFSILSRRLFEMMAEQSQKVRLSPKSAFLTDDRYGIFGGGKQGFGVIQAHFGDKIGEALPGFFAEQGAEVMGLVSALGGNIIKSELISEMLENIFHGGLQCRGVHRLCGKHVSGHGNEQ